MNSIPGRRCRCLGWSGRLVTGALALHLLTLPGWTAERPREIPSEAVPFQGHWYALYYEEIHAWPEAVQACQNKGGFLACLETPEEREFVKTYGNSVTTRRFWVGGFRKEETWSWITGPAIPSNEITGTLPSGSVRLCVSSTEQGRKLTCVPEQPVSELKSYVCEWAPAGDVTLTLPDGSSAAVPSSHAASLSPSPSTSAPKDAPLTFQGQTRTWTSTNGGQVVAELVEFDGKTLKLRTGKREMSLMVNQLSPEDQIFLKSWPPAKAVPVPADKTAPLKPWPATVEVSRTPEITVVAEDETAKQFVYRSPHYEFTAPIRLANSTVQELAVVFEATYALVDALPVGMNLRAAEKAPFKVLLVEDIEDIIKLGGPGNCEFTYLKKIDSVIVTLGNLGAEKKNGRWSFSARKATLWDVRLRIAEQLYSPLTGRLPVWFDMGFGTYVVEMRYDNGRFLVSGQRGALRDFLKWENPATTFPMPDLKSCMEMDSAQWTALVEASKLDGYYAASVLLVYYFLHLDGEGDSAFAASYIKAIAAKMPPKQAQEKFLLRGRSYAGLASDLEREFRDVGIRIEVQPPQG